MSEFSNMADYYIQQKNVKIAPMIQYCDIDRSTMYKVLKGKRNPPSLQFVEKMAEFMELTPLEKGDLIEAYKITIIGTNIYYRRKNILKLFSNYPEKGLRSDLAPLTAPADTPLSDFPKTDTDLPIESRSNIQRILYQILLKESFKSDSLIQIIAQPDWNYLFELLQVLGHKNSSLNIQHIICMSNDVNTNYKYRDYNISYLQQILPLFQSDIQYKPRYYYDNIDSHFRNLNMLPYWIITSEYALSCSSDIQYAILYKNPGTVRMLKEIFQQQYQKTSAFFTRLSDSGIDFLTLIRETFTSDCTYSISAYPCIIPALTRDMYDTYIIPDIPDRTQFIETLTQHSFDVKNLHQKKLLKDYFTKKGLTYFMESGQTKDLPKNLYTPLSIPDRKKILTHIIEGINLGHSYMLSGELESLPLNIGCLSNSKTGILMTTDSDDKFVYLSLEEKNIFDSFLDCTANLAELGVVAEKEAALEYLRGVLGKY